MLFLLVVLPKQAYVLLGLWLSKDNMQIVVILLACDKSLQRNWMHSVVTKRARNCLEYVFFSFQRKIVEGIYLCLEPDHFS